VSKGGGVLRVPVRARGCRRVRHLMRLHWLRRRLLLLLHLLLHLHLLLLHLLLLHLLVPPALLGRDLSPAVPRSVRACKAYSARMRQGSESASAHARASVAPRACKRYARVPSEPG
jgi:hypothetical protein